MSRLDTTFQRLRRQGRKALIPYVTAGYPGVDITPALMHVLVEAGADIIELGVPFSDPSADGPTIQAASEYALRQGIGLLQVFDYVARGGDLDPLWCGKIAEHHLPVVDELRERGLLLPPLVAPEFLSRPVAVRQLERIRADTPFIDLVRESPTC